MRAGTAAAADPFLARLDAIEHIVVVMLENRSFDHLLGYLSLHGGRADIDGLQPGFSNPLQNEPDPYPIRPMRAPAMGQRQDPCHKGACVDAQLGTDNQGFVQNYYDTHKELDPSREWDVVMGYYDAGTLPTYDFLAANFCVCNRWFCSVRGETWPNRLYAVAGRCAGSRDNPSAFFGLPQYNLPSFVRHLDRRGVSWKWYGDPDAVTLRYADGNYRSSENFDEVEGFIHNGFVHDAAQGTLPALAWIDPNMGYDPVFRHQNDDHPPNDIREGQKLVAKIYHAVSTGPLWDKTLLIVVYDEHGGFFDHVPPDSVALPADDDPALRHYGPRVPAIVISPYVAPRSTSDVVFDHASIVKTILLRFCRDGDSIPDMGARVQAANHLGMLLRDAREPAAPVLPAALVDRLAQAHAQAFRAAFAAAPEPRELTEFQRGLLAAKQKFGPQNPTAARAAIEAGTARVKRPGRRTPDADTLRPRSNVAATTRKTSPAPAQPASRERAEPGAPAATKSRHTGGRKAARKTGTRKAAVKSGTPKVTGKSGMPKAAGKAGTKRRA